jgi:large subunit ribosomal protein L3
VQIRTKERDGYSAVQIGFDYLTKSTQSNKPEKGHFAKANVRPTRFLREFRVENAVQESGAELTVELFNIGDRVKVTGKGKGRGFQGVVKRHHFGGIGMTTHGQSDRVRAPGSIGGSSYPSRVFPGQRMAGRMGYETRTIRNLEILDVIPEENLLVIKGSVPGAINSLVEIVRM